ncbi:MAG: DUF4352 domain-containing protein [Candidatus Altiarchaeota archaeon]
MNYRTYLTLVFSLLVFSSGCITTPEKTNVLYECPNGQLVENRSKCPTIGEEPKPVTTIRQTTAAATTTPTTVKEVVVKTPKTYEIGDTISGGNLAVKVNSVRKTDKLTTTMDLGETYTYEQEPESGFQYLIVDISVDNIGDISEAISTLMQMTVHDGEGYTYDQDIMTAGFLSKSFKGGELSPGMKMRGDVAFQVPKTATDLQFIFDYEFFGVGQAIIDLE